MKETLRQRLDSFSDRFEELAMLLSDPEVINNQQRFRDYSGVFRAGRTGRRLEALP